MARKTTANILDELYFYEAELYSLKRAFNLNNHNKEQLSDIKDKITRLKLELSDSSHYLFPNSIVTIYNKPKLHRALVRHKCLFCYNDIFKGNLYKDFRPILINHSTNEKYVVYAHTKAKICEGCFNLIPDNIQELDDLFFQLNYESNNNDDCYSYTDKPQIQRILDLTGDGLSIKKIGDKQNKNVLDIRKVKILKQQI